MLILFFPEDHKSKTDLLKNKEMGQYGTEGIFMILFENMNRTNDEIKLT